MPDEVYISTDVEADGPIPGPHSMLAVASAAYSRKGVIVGRWSANLYPLEGARPHPRVTEFWQDHPEALAATQKDRRDPGEAMAEYRRWLEALPGQPTFVAYPATYDFCFVYWYLHRFTDGCPFSHSGIDIKTMAWLLLGGAYRRSTKRSWPRRWFPKNASHTHIARDDALEQGGSFFLIWDEVRERLGQGPR